MKLALPDDFAPIATGIVAVSLVGAYFYKKSTGYKTVPDAPTGILENIAGFSGPKAPFFVLETARRVGSWNFRFYLPGTYFYVIGDHRLVREILLDKTTDKPREVYEAFEGTAAKTMFTSTNSDYMKAMRKSTAHSFSRNEVGRMNAIATKYIDEWLNGRLKDLAESGETFDPAKEFNRITFFVICEAAFEYMATDEEFEAFEHNAGLSQVEFISKSPANPFRKYVWRFIPSAREAHQASDALLEFAGRVIEAYRKKPKSERSTANTLIRILESNKAITSEHQRRSEVKDWMTAGHDTTGYSLANMATLLAKSPEIQQKLQAALKANGKDNKPEDCEYFKNVIKESMRIMPVAAGGSGRVTGREYPLKDGRVLPKRSNCFFNQYLMNHNPDVYGPTVGEFQPERWEEPTAEMKVAMSPFALGPRSCPGQSLAMSEIHNTIPRLLEKYSLELVEEGDKVFFLTLKYKGTKLRAKKL